MVHDESTQRDLQHAKLPAQEFTNIGLIILLQTSSFGNHTAFHESHPYICILTLTLLGPNHPAAPLLTVIYSSCNCVVSCGSFPILLEAKANISTDGGP